MSPRADSQIYIGPRNIQFVEKRLAHLFVIVLSRMDQPRVDAGSPQRRDQASDLDEVRPRADDDTYETLVS